MALCGQLAIYTLIYIEFNGKIEVRTDNDSTAILEFLCDSFKVQDCWTWVIHGKRIFRVQHSMVMSLNIKTDCYVLDLGDNIAPSCGFFLARLQIIIGRERCTIQFSNNNITDKFSLHMPKYRLLELPPRFLNWWISLSIRCSPNCLVSRT